LVDGHAKRVRAGIAFGVALRFSVVIQLQSASGQAQCHAQRPCAQRI
jgi:hypothetical protein